MEASCGGVSWVMDKQAVLLMVEEGRGKREGTASQLGWHFHTTICRFYGVEALTFCQWGSRRKSEWENCVGGKWGKTVGQRQQQQQQQGVAGENGNGNALQRCGFLMFSC